MTSCHCFWVSRGASDVAEVVARQNQINTAAKKRNAFCNQVQKAFFRISIVATIYSIRIDI